MSAFASYSYMLLSLLLLSIRNSCLAASITTAFTECPNIDSMDASGQIPAFASATVANLAACMSLCEATSGCVGGVYNNNGGQSVCYLKNSVVLTLNTVASGGNLYFIQSQYTSGCPAIGYSFTDTLYTQCPNIDSMDASGQIPAIAAATVANQAACMSLCSTTSGCIAGVYNNNGGQSACYLKNSVVLTLNTVASGGNLYFIQSQYTSGCPAVGYSFNDTFYIQCPGLDSGGFADLGGFVASSVAACMSFCSANSACVGAVYTGPQNGNGNCYLKNNLVLTRAVNAGSAAFVYVIQSQYASGCPAVGYSFSDTLYAASLPLSVGPTSISSLAAELANGRSSTLLYNVGFGGALQTVGTPANGNVFDIIPLSIAAFDPSSLFSLFTTNCASNATGLVCSSSSPGTASAEASPLSTQLVTISMESNTNCHLNIWGGVTNAGVTVRGSCDGNPQTNEVFYFLPISVSPEVNAYQIQAWTQPSGGSVCISSLNPAQSNSLVLTTCNLHDPTQVWALYSLNCSSLCVATGNGFVSNTAGYFCTSSSACGICPAGSYCPVGSAATPIACPAGTFSRTGASSCQSCPIGYYSSASQSQCTSCIAGYTTNSPGATSWSQCAPCNFGTYSDVDTSFVCESCPSGYYCPGGQTKIGCSAGKFSSNIGARTESSCAYCSAGTYSLLGSSVCSLCPAGFRQPSVGASLCSPCPYGSFSIAGSSDCILCPAGTYSSDRLSCYSCPAGTYSGPGFAGCITCPAGFSSKSGGTQCISCGRGLFSSAGDVSCSKCAPGTYTDLQAAPYCYVCPVGTYQPNSGTSSCLTCSTNTKFTGQSTC